MLGASAEWNKATITNFSCLTQDGTDSTRLAYNQFTGGAWQLTEVASNDFVLYHIFATTEKDNPMIAIMGQNDYANRSAAREGALTEVQTLILDNVLFPEIRPIATIIYQTNTSYANSVNAKIVSTDSGDDYIDWRNEAISRTEVATTDHDSLNNVALAQDGVTNGHISDTTQSIKGIKNFSTSVGLGTETPRGLFDATQDTVGTGSFTYPFPCLTTTQIGNLTGMAAGAFVYDTTTNELKFYNGSAWAAV